MQGSVTGGSDVAMVAATISIIIINIIIVTAASTDTLLILLSGSDLRASHNSVNPMRQVYHYPHFKYKEDEAERRT